MPPFFTHPDTAAAYEPAPGFETDRNILVPGAYSGNLSNIPPQVADKVFSQGTNLFVKKEAPAAIASAAKLTDAGPAVPAAAPADEKAAAKPAATDKTVTPKK
jgi:hypothetical protein